MRASCLVSRVDELSRPLALVPNDRRSRLETIDPAQPMSAEDGVGARRRDARVPGIHAPRIQPQSARVIPHAASFDFACDGLLVSVE
jgi:hypothetical protein